MSAGRFTAGDRVELVGRPKGREWWAGAIKSGSLGTVVAVYSFLALVDFDEYERNVYLEHRFVRPVEAVTS